MVLCIILKQEVLRPSRLRSLKLVLRGVVILLCRLLVHQELGGVVVVHVKLARNLLLTLEVFWVFLAFVELVLLGGCDRYGPLLLLSWNEGSL